MEYLEDSLDTGQTEDGLRKFMFVQHQRCPYSPSDSEYLGSSYNLLIEWETGEMGTFHQHHGKCQALWTIQSKVVADGHIPRNQLKLLTQELFS